MGESGGAAVVVWEHTDGRWGEQVAEVALLAFIGDLVAGQRISREGEASVSTSPAVRNHRESNKRRNRGMRGGKVPVCVREVIDGMGRGRV